jgi:prolipoprotein diacylglyceryl transferase
VIWDIDPVLLNLGPLQLRWYSLLFAGGIFIGFLMIKAWVRAEGKSESLLDSGLTYVVIGTIVGARLAHCFFYEPEIYLNEPLRILKVWEGGLASHGGYLGVILALVLFSRKVQDMSFFWLADRVAIPAMLCGAMIRTGNLFNSEILGRPAEGLPWAIIFQRHDSIPRHPVMLYEALGYLSIFIISYGLYRAWNRKVPEGKLLGLIMVLAFSFRIFAERFKEAQADFENELPFHMGQALSVPFIIIGIYLFLGWHRKNKAFHWALSPEARE